MECPFGSPDWVCNEVERCFRCSTVEHSNRHPSGDIDGCLECKLSTIQISPTIRGQARNTIAPATGRNSWEKGFAIDERGLPMRDFATGAPISIKRYADNRSKYDESRRANRQKAGV